MIFRKGGIHLSAVGAICGHATTTGCTPAKVKTQLVGVTALRWTAPFWNSYPAGVVPLWYTDWNLGWQRICDVLYHFFIGFIKI